MAFDYKKEYKELYFPPKKPMIINVPEINYVAVRGKGNPNVVGGEYQLAMNVLYSLAFTIKMSYKGDHRIDGFFEYVVPPLEGLWWQEGSGSFDATRKDEYHWISMIRLPEFVTGEVFAWAKAEAEQKKKKDMSSAEFFTYHEGLCVQCMHIGPYDEEKVTIDSMDAYAIESGYALDIGDKRLHHEIYLGDPRKGDPAKLKTVIREPIKKQG